MQWDSLILALVSIGLTGGLVLFIKKILGRYRRPNGKKRGIVSFNIAVAFATVTVVALTTRDWFLTALTVLLAYLLTRNRIDERQHYIYQVVISAALGIAIPYGLWYLWYTKIRPGSGDSPGREYYPDKPDNATDDRHQADDAPELRLVSPGASRESRDHRDSHRDSPEESHHSQHRTPKDSPTTTELHELYKEIERE